MARLILTEPGEDVDVGGNVTVIGTTSGGEVITVLRGNIILDPSFNAGGDTIRLPDLASAFTVRISGSVVTLVSETVTIAIPVGVNAIQIAFDDVTRNLFFDNNTIPAAAKLGTQVITTSETGVLPLGATAQILGTPDNDVIDGTADADVMDGLAGNDTINGLGGDDFIRGGIGDDTLTGGAGDDQIIGGAGNDRIIDNEGEFAVLDGGAGNDQISVNNLTITSMSIGGGDGDDLIQLTLGDIGFIIVNAGNGADRIVVDSEAGMEVSLLLGAGRDTIEFAAGTLEAGNNGLIIARDFEVGANGDKVDIASALVGYLTNWTPGTNPFATGHLQLVDFFGNAKLVVDRDGAAGPNLDLDELVLFAGIDKATLTAENFNGFDPKAATASVAPASLASAGEPDLFAQGDDRFGDLSYVRSDPLDLFGGHTGFYFIA